MAILREAARTLRTFGPNAIENYIISKCESVSDVLEVALLFREVGLLRAGPESRPRPMLAMGIVPLFETIDDLQRRPTMLDALFSLPRYRRGRSTAADCTR